LLQAAVCAVAAFGCAHQPRQTKFMKSISGVTMSTSELRERVYELGRRQSALVEEATINAHNSTADPKVRRAVISWVLKALPDVQEATLHPDPLMALADLWALAYQTEAVARQGPGRERFGDAHVFIERAAQQMARESEDLATLAMGAQGLAKKRARVQAWAAANPITSGTFARPSASVVWADALGGDPRGARGFMASTEDRLTEMGARMEMMNQTMLDRVRWTSELVIADALGKENVSAVLDEVRTLIASEQAKLIRDIDVQRRQIFADVAAVRADAFRDIARERDAIFDRVAGERAAITSQADTLLEEADTRARGLVHGALWRLGVGAAVLIVLAAAAAWLVAHALRRRRPEGPRGAPRRFEPASAPTV
jgi:hypothetical protein